VAAAIVPPLPERGPNDESGQQDLTASHASAVHLQLAGLVPRPAAALQTQCSACAAHLGTDCWRVDKPVFGGVVSIGACDQAKAVGNITSPHRLVVDA
jgi:hypothetical protein